MLAAAQAVDQGAAVAARLDDLDDVRFRSVRGQHRRDERRKLLAHLHGFLRQRLFASREPRNLRKPAVFFQ